MQGTGMPWTAHCALPAALAPMVYRVRFEVLVLTLKAMSGLGSVNIHRKVLLSAENNSLV